VSIHSLIVQQVNLLVDLWNKVSFPTEDDTETEFKLSDYKLSRRNVKGFLEHFQNCKDCSADNAFLMATQNDEGEDVLRLNNVYFPLLVEDDDDNEWGQFDPSLLGDKHSDERTIFPVEDRDEVSLCSR